jgi:hypothetical protein
MPGAIFLGGAKQGICYLHYGRLPSDWGRITRSITDWKCVCAEALHCRRVLVSPETMTDAKAQNAQLAGAWTRLRTELLGGPWLHELQPKEKEQYSSWGRRLEQFLAARLQQSMQGALA